MPRTYEKFNVIARTMLLALALCTTASVVAAQAVAVGDIVETGLNGGTPVIGEVTRAAGALADLNISQGRNVPLLEVQYMKVLQKAGTGGKSACAVGDTVQVRSLANVLFAGKIMKTNGAYCEIDSSGSGFTGWSTCSDMRRPSGGTCAPPSAAVQGRTGGAPPPATGPQPPRPGLTSCAGKIEDVIPRPQDSVV
jgi:hypothetical protein